MESNRVVFTAQLTPNLSQPGSDFLLIRYIRTDKSPLNDVSILGLEKGLLLVGFSMVHRWIVYPFSGSEKCAAHPTTPIASVVCVVFDARHLEFS